MADLKYDVAAVFSSGVNPELLADQLSDAWPDGLEPVEISLSDGRPNRRGVYNSGVLTIHTKRDITPAEETTRQSVFAAHVARARRKVVRKNRLKEGNEPGELMWVEDAPRASSGTGCVCYWDDRDSTWRRLSDDAVVQTV
jgi:hypothetical protein